MGESRRRKMALGTNYGSIPHPTWTRNRKPKKTADWIRATYQDLLLKAEKAEQENPQIKEEIDRAIRTAQERGEDVNALIDGYMQMPEYRPFLEFTLFCVAMEEAIRESLGKPEITDRIGLKV